MMISFVVLSFNQEKIIKKLFDSIRFSCNDIEYEIILCDNNSDDSIKDMFYDYLNHYNIKGTFVLNTLSKNQSTSRNMGIKIASGKYICFIDGDDYINPVNMQYVINEMKSNKDIIFVSRYYRDQNISKIIEVNLNNPTQCGICYYIPKRQYLIDNNILFEENKYYYYSEDIWFFVLLIDSMKTDNVTVINNNYNYYGIKSETSTNYNNIDKFELTKYYCDMYNDLNKKLKTQLAHNIFYILIQNMLSYINRK